MKRTNAICLSLILAAAAAPALAGPQSSGAAAASSSAAQGSASSSAAAGGLSATNSATLTSSPTQGVSVGGSNPDINLNVNVSNSSDARPGVGTGTTVVPLTTTAAPEGAETPAEEPPLPPDRWFLHGVRLGYNYIMNMEQSDLDAWGLQSPHQFLVGYEFMQRIIGYDWLNIILVQNVMIGGLEQSRFLPSANFIFGFEIMGAIQAGVGINLVPVPNDFSHLILTAGWTPLVGRIYVPVHAFFVPDVNGHHRIGASFGFTW